MNRTALDYHFENDCIRQLIAQGRTLGYIFMDDLLKCLPTDIKDQDQITDIVSMIVDMGITVRGVEILGT